MCSLAVRSPRRLSASALVGASLLLLATACASHFVARGSELYDQGHYVEAAEMFERTEARLASSSNGERARFGLYRGATFLKLGDVEHAARWLGYARSIQKSDGDALDSDEAALLDASLMTLGNDGSAPERKERSEVATAPPAVEAAPNQ